MKPGICILLIALFLTHHIEASAGWSELGKATGPLNGDSAISVIVCGRSGDVYAAGQIADSSGKYYVAHWDGAAWSPLGSGSASLGANGSVVCLATDLAGNIYAAGNFTNAAGMRYVAKWNGTSWSELGNGSAALNANGGIRSLAIDRAGNIYAAGDFRNSSFKIYVARWNGSTWTEVGPGSDALISNGNITSVRFDRSGNLYAAGAFTKAGNLHYLAQWDGSTWTETASGLDLYGAQPGSAVSSMEIDKNNQIYVTGMRNDSGRYFIACWNGTSWTDICKLSPIARTRNSIFSLACDTAGNLYAPIIPDTGRYYIATWNGTTWAKVGEGADALNPNSFILALATDAAGHLYAAGAFTNGIAASSGHTYVASYQRTDRLFVPRISGSPALRLFPNPNQGSFLLHSDMKAFSSQIGIDISICNAAGIEIYRRHFIATTPGWDLPITLRTDLPEGVYYLRAQGENINAGLQVVKTN